MWQRAILGGAILLFGVSGAEAQSSRAAFVEQLYETYFGRQPYYSELDYWLDRMTRQGDSRDVVEAGIIGSPAYFQQNRYNTNLWMREVFREVLGRGPRGNELEWWRRRLSQYHGDREDWALEFLSEMRTGRRHHASYRGNDRGYREDYDRRDYGYRDRYGYTDRYGYRDNSGYRDDDRYRDRNGYREQYRYGRSW